MRSERNATVVKGRGEALKENSGRQKVEATERKAQRKKQPEDNGITKKKQGSQRESIWGGNKDTRGVQRKRPSVKKWGISTICQASRKGASIFPRTS